jgi:hypothetical protein
MGAISSVSWGGDCVVHFGILNYAGFLNIIVDSAGFVPAEFFCSSEGHLLLASHKIH